MLGLVATGWINTCILNSLCYRSLVLLTTVNKLPVSWKHFRIASRCLWLRLINTCILNSLSYRSRVVLATVHKYLYPIFTAVCDYGRWITVSWIHCPIACMCLWLRRMNSCILNSLSYHFRLLVTTVDKHLYSEFTVLSLACACRFGG